MMRPNRVSARHPELGALPILAACPEITCLHPTGHGPAPCYTPTCGPSAILPPKPPSPPAPPAESWLSASTIMPGVENLLIVAGAAGAALLAYFLLEGQGGGKR